MSVHFETESGSRYEIDDGLIRRVNPEAAKRADGEWVALYSMIPYYPVAGSRVELALKSLADRGPDDYGTQTPSNVTFRLTTPVVRVWEES